MKIAIFSYTMDRKAMGTALYTRELIKNILDLKNQDDEIFLIHRERNDDPLYKQVNEIFLPKINLPRFSYFLSEAIFLWKTRKDFEVIHYPQESIYPLFWLSKAKIVLTVHSAMEGWQKFSYLRRRWWLVYWTLKLFHKRISSIIAISNSTKKSIQRFFAVPDDKIHVIYQGVDQSFFKEIKKEEARKLMNSKYGLPVPYILNGSRIDPHKNVQRLIRAYAILKKRHNGTVPKLIIGAKHWPAENRAVENLINDLNLKTEIFSTPYIASEDMPQLYAGAEMFVFPSLHEGFGLPIIESMAAGTPVITSNVFSMPEISGNAAMLVDPYDVQSIASAMEKILNDPSCVSDLVSRGSLLARTFDWRKTAEETILVYSSL
ncbi:MAG: glycosyltransferase family 1 protein [bacterium]|nr:glycosyltransferase family 1 protein [bacterium]